MPKGRHKRKVHGSELYKKSRVLKRTKMRTLKSVSRKEQPSPIITVPRLRESVLLEEERGYVASSWIARILWKGQWAWMVLLNGYSYNVYIPFKVFEQWYYATSKGTFFNGNIKGKYKVVRSA